MKRLLLAIPFLALLILPGSAQEVPDKPVPPSKPETLHEVRLGSGTVLIGIVEPRQWTILTKFGVLRVPVENIKRVRFGRKSQPERFRTVVELIDHLASANPERRNHAQAQLKVEGAFAAPELARAAKRHADPEVRRQCQEILDGLSIDEEDYIGDDDRVDTTLFSVRGSVTLKSFKVTVKELGSLNIERKDITLVTSRSSAPMRRFKVSGQFTSSGTWLDTKLKITKGIKLKITADGTVHYPRWGNQMMTPDGNPAMGNINGIWMGSLIGKVGASGSLFRVGRSYSGKPQGKGTLHLALMMNQRGQPSTGEFTVTIEEQ